MTSPSPKKRIDAQMHRSFAHLEANGTNENLVEAFVAFLRSPGTLRRPPLIVRCQFKEGSFQHSIVTDNPRIHRRLARQFLPFLDRIRARLQGSADVLVLLSDSVYVVESQVAQFVDFVRRVPFLRGDWLEGDPVSSNALAIPDFTLQDESYGREIESIDEAASRTPFASRKDLMKWRGRLTGPGYPDAENCHRFPRYHLLRLAAESPEIIDARITHYDNFPDTDAGRALRQQLNALLGGPAPEIPPSDFASYKYLISTDGVASTWKRVANSLRTGSVLLMQHRWRQFFYPGLVPWEHYVPIADDLANLPARYAWLRAHPEVAERIGGEGRRFAEIFLSVNAIEDHFATVLNRCASLPRAGLQ
ncbi:glycosyl transferase family 90 [Marilutibacter chinensis]|uniref:Glycosyl transferase CAP10 domain-containing protein n=1 Tax=Marilutibacter chinensis TaxID=2912247 RepID=A0ABS9HZH6_9GAMM|nr:glycosyl transferase family 90 [Lysobacter chinensis]MCF7223782.1 hypothetical protein [Lysobacter chinensis]